MSESGDPTKRSAPNLSQAREERKDRCTAAEPAEIEAFDDGEPCPTCGGEGFVDEADHPELWDEDWLSTMPEMVPCPDCARPARGGDA